MKRVDWSVRWRAVLLGAGAGCVTMICCCAGAAGLMAYGLTDVEAMGYFAALILVCGGLMGGFAAMLGGGGAADAALAALVELVVLVGLNGVLNGGEMEGTAVTALALFGGCGGMILLRRGAGGRKRHHRRR